MVSFNKDLWDNNIRNEYKASNHYYKQGKRENRVINYPDFDYIYYITKYKDVEKNRLKASVLKTDLFCKFSSLST